MGRTTAGCCTVQHSPVQQQLAVLREHLTRCKEQKTRSKPLNPHEPAHIHSFTRDKWRVEIEQTQEVISSFEEMAAAYA